MSRVDKKKIEKKQKIKETIIGIALAIAIGVGGSVGSYAYFSDMVKSDNGIKITMGTLDVDIDPGFNLQEFYQGEEYEQSFSINNEGTLDQILTLKINNILFNGIQDSDKLNNFKYELDIGDQEYIYTLKELSSPQGVNIGRLDSGGEILCTATLINEGINDEDMKITFDLVVDAVQINDKSVQNGGAN